jgi:hypothetical protein
MVSRDIGYIVLQLEKRIAALEKAIKNADNRDTLDKIDWDNSRLMREWSISKRTAANYRKAGLDFYKRGGRIFYTAESRGEFCQQRKMKIHGEKK